MFFIMFPIFKAGRHLKPKVEMKLGWRTKPRRILLRSMWKSERKRHLKKVHWNSTEIATCTCYRCQY